MMARSIFPHHPNAGADTMRIAALLSLLGRLEFVPGSWLGPAVLPEVAPATWARLLSALHRERLVWKHPIPVSRIPAEMLMRRGNMPRVPPLLWGLTERGRAWLAEHGVDDAATRGRLVTRDWKQPDVRAAQLAHDLMVVRWCLSALTTAAQNAMLVGARCVVEYVSLIDERGQAVQRFDALLTLTFDPRRRRRERPSWAIPWTAGEGKDNGGLPTLRVALEADRGTEKLAILLGKAVMYRDLSLDGHYAATLGGPVTPVVICPPGRRAAQIAREWYDGWPGGRGIISSTIVAYDKRLGALWGDYFTMTERPSREVTLLAEVGIDREDWVSTLA